MRHHSRARALALLLLATTLAIGCDTPFDPYEANTAGPFAMYGYLDLKAETQWIRVTPIRRTLLSDSAAIDAVVTLEHLESGRVVTLRDSLFTFADRGVDGAAYTHNFWTAEPIEPESTYRLRAVRSDGAASTALIETPRDLAVTLEFWRIDERGDNPRRVLRQVAVEGERLLYVDLLYTVWDTSLDRGVPPFAVRWPPSVAEPGRWRFGLPGVGPFDLLDEPPLFDMRRRELQIAVAGSDWPYEPGMDVDEVPSNVENGIGSVRAVATWRLAARFCVPLEPRPDGTQDCTTRLDASSTSIHGTVARDPCARPFSPPTLRLTERYADGGAVVWDWSPDWDGSYRFEGLEPGSELLLEFDGHPGGTIAIPPLEPGEHYAVPPVEMPSTCE